MYQSRRAGDEAKKRKSPAKSGRVGITVRINLYVPTLLNCIIMLLMFETFQRDGGQNTDPLAVQGLSPWVTHMDYPKID